ncbi:hypothetical protein [Nocardioides nitrophenolicus]|uniref:hypothetical protein n=1 Tax=Nocardioides nitrophenolicus TaxID=60489 RepID=UPI00195E0489|nr:hypothetical protein [Nocardioides nitrophenolicus]MBM7516687.1 hypothetical protein [Nocardioides nitrophenolicus]
MTATLAPGSSVARWGRATVVGAWVALLAALAHAVSSGTAPSLVAIVPVAVASAGVVRWWGPRELRFASTWALLAASQVAAHLLASYVHGHAMAPSAAMLAAHLAGLAVVAAGLARADALWWSWWRRVSLIVRTTPRPSPESLTRLWTPRPAVVPPCGTLAHAVVRRGPPPC